jgi:hypothetical protein
MRRPVIVGLALLVAAGVAAVPAEAGKKPKPIKGSYTVQLPPDPTGNVGTTGCAGLLPISEDRHQLKLPAKGILTVHLSGDDPASTQQLEWDLAILDADMAAVSSSTSAGSEEETVDKIRKKQTVYIQACNLAGLPNATITYTFTYA